MSLQTPPLPPDDELLERIAGRDQSALSELYDRHGRMLYSIILAVVRDTDDAEEILQEVFVAIWKGAGAWRADLGVPRTWMLRMAHAAAIDRLRARRGRPGTGRIRPETDPAQTSSAPASDPDPAPDPESGTPIASVLSTLPIDERAVIDMAFLQGYSHDEIARLTGVTPGTVKNRIRTGMVALRSNLGFSSSDISVGQRS